MFSARFMLFATLQKNGVSEGALFKKKFKC